MTATVVRARSFMHSRSCTVTNDDTLGLCTELSHCLWYSLSKPRILVTSCEGLIHFRVFYYQPRFVKSFGFLKSKLPVRARLLVPEVINLPV